MFVAYVVIMTGLALCSAYADFGLNKPRNWTARDWTYWALTVFSLLVLRNVIVNDPRWMSGPKTSWTAKPNSASARKNPSA